MTYPIVLAHGICRFDRLTQMALGHDNREDDDLHYFRRIRSTLRSDGFTVYHSRVPWAAQVGRRAAKLRGNVDRILRRERCDKVHIIAHSMGGLDARHMLFRYRRSGMHRKVASLTTIGTPHHGTTFADWGVARLGGVIDAVTLLGLNVEGLRDLTTHACRAFNRASRSFERSCGVAFQTIAGVQESELVFAPLRLPYLLIALKEGPNDGLVSLTSARWMPRYFRKSIAADHLNELGWWEPSELGLIRLPGRRLRRETRRAMEARIRREYLLVARQLRREFPLRS
jgi:triacylglycerol lipase